jgi:hypothetical protein
VKLPLDIIDTPPDSEVGVIKARVTNLEKVKNLAEKMLSQGPDTAFGEITPLCVVVRHERLSTDKIKETMQKLSTEFNGYSPGYENTPIQVFCV